VALLSGKVHTLTPDCVCRQQKRTALYPATGAGGLLPEDAVKQRLIATVTAIAHIREEFPTFDLVKVD